MKNNKIPPFCYVDTPNNRPAIQHIDSFLKQDQFAFSKCSNEFQTLKEIIANNRTIQISKSWKKA